MLHRKPSKVIVHRSKAGFRVSLFLCFSNAGTRIPVLEEWWLIAQSRSGRADSENGTGPAETMTHEDYANSIKVRVLIGEAEFYLGFQLINQSDFLASMSSTIW